MSLEADLRSASVELAGCNGQYAGAQPTKYQPDRAKYQMYMAPFGPGLNSEAELRIKSQLLYQLSYAGRSPRIARDESRAFSKGLMELI
jgi:hypothetical protein